MMAGYSTHLYLPIRAAQHPGVNEGAPATWDKLSDLLERKQYGEMKPLERRAALGAQLDKEFLRYLRRQWVLVGARRLRPAAGVARRARPRHRSPRLVLEPGPQRLADVPARRVPAAGARTARGLVAVPARETLVRDDVPVPRHLDRGHDLFLNFTDHEVRDRDYFFQSGFHGYAMWIALGVARLVEWVRESFDSEEARRLATIGSTALLSLQPFLLMSNLWFTHDRSHNYIARDYAYNMLATLKPELVHVHERRQRHVPAVVHPAGRGLPQGRAHREPVAAQHRLVHPASCATRSRRCRSSWTTARSTCSARGRSTTTRAT
jgi:hypothetical protein